MKKHIYVCEKIITFVLAFALIIGLWSSIGVDAKAADEATIYRDGGGLIKSGDIINTGDTVVINVPKGKLVMSMVLMMILNQQPEQHIHFLNFIVQAEKYLVNFNLKDHRCISMIIRYYLFLLI